MHVAIADSNACPVASGVSAKNNALQSNFVVLNSHVVQILRASGLPKIAPTIVGSIAIDVVNLVSGPAAGHVENGQPAGEISLAPYADNKPTIRRRATSLFAFALMLIQSVNAPCESASFRIVMKRRF